MNVNIFDDTTGAFFELVRAGLWERDASLLSYEKIDYSSVFRLSKEQSVVGLVAAGLEHIVDTKVPKEVVLSLVGETLQLEQHNNAMNFFISVIVDKMRQAGIYTILVKGQGVAQCYERPLWRACGDIDFLLSESNYQNAKAFLIPLANSVEAEDISRRHLGMTINPWTIELHGTMHTGISHRMNKVIDESQEDVFYNGNVRSWMNGDTQVFLPSPDNDVVFIFTHYISHFYGEGIGLRQICDWCRVLWTYRDKIRIDLLERRLKKMGLMSEWKAFASLAVNYLGMPSEAMPLFSSNKKYLRKASSLCHLVIESGDLGQNNDKSYRLSHSRFVVNIITFFRRFGEFVRIGMIFPYDSIRFFLTYISNRIKYII